jgi:hypothetical protein
MKIGKDRGNAELILTYSYEQRGITCLGDVFFNEY